MKVKDGQISGYDGDEMGDVDLFGLDEFGAPMGMNPLWGAIIGGGVGTGTSIALRALTPASGGSMDYHKWSEGLGFAAGALASGIMIAFPGTRAAGWAGLATAFLTNGLRQLEILFTGSSPTHGIGLVTPERLRGVMVEPLHGLGVAVPESVPQMHGVAGPQISTGRPPVDLLQRGALPSSSRHAEIMGAQMSGLGAHYGVTLFGGDN